MKDYIIAGETLRDVMYCYNYMLRLLNDKIIRASKRDREIYIDEYILHFVSSEMYWNGYMRGSRADVISCYYVERQLDRYRILKGELYD